MAYSKAPLTPTSVNQYIKNILENDGHLKQLFVTGEVSNVKYHSNGNIYFSIKDQKAQINCLMFKTYSTQMKFKLIEGDKIELLGSFYLYNKMGQYSINVIKIRKTGQGDLYQKFLELKEQLKLKGYFLESNKKSIREFPQKIAVITSPTGAAVKDVISTIKRRYPVVKIVVIPTIVQGAKSANDIVKNIENVNRLGNYDTIILGRGGGSIEDLWSFNEPVVAQAIFNSKVPVISAVGHETDFTIADFVADKRAPTPTAAAELATPDISEIKMHLKKNIIALRQSLQQQIDLETKNLKIIKENQYFKNPLLNFENRFHHLDTIISGQSKLLNEQINTYQQKLLKCSFNNKKSIKEIIDRNLNNLEHQKENLDNLNPLNILSKGYNTVQKENKYIKSIKQLKKNDKIVINLNDGNVDVEVQKITKKKLKIDKKSKPKEKNGKK